MKRFLPSKKHAALALLWDRTLCPSAKDLAQQLRLASAHEAIALLQEMQADGVIDVLREGAYPWVSLVRKRYTGLLIAGQTRDPVCWENQEIGQGDEVPSEQHRAAPTTVCLSSADASANSESPEGGEEGLAAGETAPEMPERPEDAAVAAPQAVETKRIEPEDALTLPADDDGSSEADAPPVQAEEEQAQAREPEPQRVEASQLGPVTYAEVAAFMKKHSMLGSNLGRRATKDPGLVGGLKKGRVPGEAVSARVRAFMQEFERDTPAASGTAREASGAVESTTATRIEDRAAHSEGEGAHASLPLTADTEWDNATSTTRSWPEYQDKLLKERPGDLAREIQAAFQTDGRDYDSFLKALLFLGLQSYRDMREAA